MTKEEVEKLWMDNPESMQFLTKYNKNSPSSIGGR